MSSGSLQLFNQAIPPPLEILYGLLKRICVVQDTYYVFDINAFKRGLLLDAYGDFMAACISYYRTSKQYYCMREHTFNNIATIFRQICNAHNSRFVIPANYKNLKHYTITYMFPL